MNSVLKWSAISLVAGYFINCGCEMLQSDFLQNFLEDKLIEILVTLLAVNTATLGIILLRLGELCDKHKTKFPIIVSAMKLSVAEQIGLIIVATICLILRGSKLIQENGEMVNFCCGTVLIAVAIYAVVVVFDTAMAAFDLNDAANKLPPPQD
jgi:hypothetical protein